MIFTIISTVPIIILSVSLLQSFQSDYIESKITKMYRDANTIASNLMITGYFDETKDDSYLQAIDAMADGRVAIVNFRGTVIYDSNHADVGNLYVSDEVIKGLRGNGQDLFDEDTYTGKVVVPIKNYVSKEIYGLVIITKRFDDVRNSVSNMVSLAVLSIIGITVLFIAISFYTSMLITKPFDQIIKYINSMIKGHVDEKLVISGNYEAEQISVAFNKLLEEIGQAETNRQQFVANVSHELKTPLSSIKVLAESLLNQDHVPEELYREFLADIDSEVDRESKIINDLLLLVTLDKKDHALNIERVNINELVQDILKRLKPLADIKNVQLLYESYRSVNAEVDESKMESAISNLIDNAIKYNKEYGIVTVTLNSNHHDFTIEVNDTGDGIEEESLDKVFRRFYRVDKTRSRNTGGTGLGLSIVKETIKKHNGTVACVSDGKSTTTFKLTTPLKHIS